MGRRLALNCLNWGIKFTTLSLIIPILNKHNAGIQWSLPMVLLRRGTTNWLRLPGASLGITSLILNLWGKRFIVWEALWNLFPSTIIVCMSLMYEIRLGSIQSLYFKQQNDWEKSIWGVDESLRWCWSNLGLIACPHRPKSRCKRMTGYDC